MKKLKQALSLTLALVLSLSLAVPAFAAGTVETLDLTSTTATITNVLRKGIYRDPEEPLYGGWEYVIYVVSDEGGKVNLVPKEGYYYYDESLPDDVLNERSDYFANYYIYHFIWKADSKEIFDDDPSGAREWPFLEEPLELSVKNESGDDVNFFTVGGGLDSLTEIVVFTESQWARIAPNETFTAPTTSAAPTQPAQPAEPAAPAQPDQPTTPAQPEQPTQPAPSDGSASYTVKQGDTLGSITTNFYGNNAQRYALQKANAEAFKKTGGKLVPGMVLTIPATLNKVSRISAPVAGEGEKLYTVKLGDTLGKIAAAEYGKVSAYKTIFERNQDRLKNANTIYEGQIIVLPAAK